MKTLEEAIDKLKTLSSGIEKNTLAKKHGLYNDEGHQIYTKHIGKIELIELLSYIYEKDTVEIDKLTYY